MVQTKRMSEQKTLTLSLISHTNVGKTTLARTLLRQDVGDAHDGPHVTDSSSAYSLIETDDGEALKLWDTPGFGDSARLLKRLKKEKGSFSWLVNKAWDRFADRPFWCSQQAVQNVQEEADVVLYLISASEDPASAGYVDMEMEILTWIGKPVMVLLNQTGAPRAAEIEAKEEEEWREHLREFEAVRAVLGLDAFARCWIQEDELMRVVAAALEKGEKRDLAEALGKAWKAKNRDVFEASAEAIAGQLAASATDKVAVTKETLLQKFWLGRRELNTELRSARNSLTERLAERAKGTMDRLIALHDLEGQSAIGFAESSLENFAMPERVSEPLWTAVGGFAAGASGGLVADLAHGGLTLGGGAILGGLGGGAGAYLLAKGMNLTRGKDHCVYWTLGHFREQVGLALLSYLAVAHFGRGRGEWEDAEHPPFWADEVKSVLESHSGKVEKVWKRGTDGQTKDKVLAKLEPLVLELLEELLERLYPDD
ncbi:MAG: hypothetical protein ACI9UA_000311 [Pseudoalteromonas tetraodonis]|jgi:hypothetical protein